MRYKLLGRSGLRVSEVGLGTMTFGEGWGWGASNNESKRIFDAYVDAGGNFVDTSNIYTFGNAESILGEIVTPERRNRVVIATKYNHAKPDNTDANAAGNHRKNMVQSVEASLKRLRTDRLDICYIHTWDFSTRPDEVMRALDDLVRQGKVLYAGISDAPAWVISRCNELADARGWSPFVCNQFEYSLLERTPERELIPMSRTLDLGMAVWSPLAGGILSGKYTRGDRSNSKNRMSVIVYKEMSERNLAIAREVDAVADELGCSSACCALAWLAAQGAIPILGATRTEQLIANLAYLDVSLSDEHLTRLNTASLIELGFPHDYLRAATGFVYGGMLDKVDRHREEGIGKGSGLKPNASTADTGFSYSDILL